jgi:gluconate 5-dehydrogenase
MNSLFDLSGRTALVTGSSGGLGLTIARGLAQAGASVVLNGRNQEKLERATESLTAAGLPAWDCAFDVADASQIRGGVERILDRAGRINVLVNNAGITRRGQLVELDVADWDAVIGTNLTAPFLVAREVAKNMIRQNGGKIINICSLMSQLARPTTGAYAAAKGGLQMLTRAMATEWAQHNIQANGIAPGYFITEMTQKLADDPEFDTWIKSRTPAGRWGLPEELMGAAVFLASPASSFISGQVIFVDGGLTACV